MRLKEICTYLEEIAPLEFQEAYDNSGLIFGEANMGIQGVLIGLDCTEAMVEEAIQKKCNLIITHHPIVFKGLKTFTGKNYIERTLIKAIQHNIALYAIHTNLDKIKIGVNHTMAQKLQLKQLQFLHSELNPTCGSGMIGEYANGIAFEEFLNRVKTTFDAPMIRYTKNPNTLIKKVALCGGSGSFLLPQAIQQKADVFLSSDFKYHQFFDAENHLSIVDIGHYEAEICTKELIYSLLTKNFPNFAFRLSETNTNPINYY